MRDVSSALPANSLSELLSMRAAAAPEREAFSFFGSDGEVSETLTYGELDRRARAVAVTISRQCRPGERALLLFGPGLEFVTTLFGCFHAGVIAVPAFPPVGARVKHGLPNLVAIVRDANCAAVLSTETIANAISEGLAVAPDLQRIRWLNSESIDDGAASLWEPNRIGPDDLAFLQYTSGSTSRPKGVCLTHRNLLHNSAQIAEAFEHTANSRAIIWLPPYHDMGLIGGVLQPFYMGFPGVLMSPLTFLSRPVRWLQAISKLRGTTSGGPDFAYRMCARKVTEDQKRDLDLSSWDVAFTGAEPIRADTLDLFCEAFRDCGFRREAFYPCYGLAEATLLVTGGKKGRLPVVLQASRSRLGGTHSVTEGVGDDALALVGCGSSHGDQNVAIVEPTTRRELPEGSVGEIWCAGASIAGGYWHREEETAEVFGARIVDSDRGPFLRTGDLGFVREGHLYITGRTKDVIIVRGRNHYPQDIERTAELVAGERAELKPGGIAAFGDGGVVEAVALCIETRGTSEQNWDSLGDLIAERVTEVHGLAVSSIAFVRPGAILKTSSGKIQRRATRQGLATGEIACWARWTAPAGESSRPDAQNRPPSAPELTTRAAIHDWLVRQAANRMRVAVEQIDADAPFARYGLDSLDAVALAGELGSKVGRQLAPTILWDHPNIRSLAAFLAGEHDEPVARIDSHEAIDKEPIAVVGMACRFPGADSPEEFWSAMLAGVDAIGEVPADRPDSEWVSASGYRAGFLRDVDRFDAAFFGITPREAETMDPQQRLLLEVAWEALERAAIIPSSLAGTAAGVFVGISNSDYLRLTMRHAPEAYAGTGNALSLAANRISYFLDLRGPSMAIDTACSSSLVAVHQAVRSLREGECDLCLAAGVNLLLTPELTRVFEQAKMLAADSRCKTFDAGADGYVRGEGCGVIVLKRLADARRDADTILAVIRGTAVNQDGRSNGLTAPNGSAQQAVVRAALRDAALEPGEVSYVEAHGTGTPLGDPIEVAALKEVHRDRNASVPCFLGSVKTNVGHLEAAAGIAGLTKVVLALQSQMIPPHLHLKKLNSKIELDSTFRIAQTPTPWFPGERPRIAGVSSFGFGGANAHVVIEEAEAAALGTRSSVERPLHLLRISGRSVAALRALAARHAERLRTIAPERFVDYCFSVNVGRTAFETRAIVIAADAHSTADALSSFANGEPSESLISGTVEVSRPPRIGFLVGDSGVDAAFVRTLARTSPTLRRAMESEDRGGGASAPSAFQPAVVTAALIETLSAWGVRPDVVLGPDDERTHEGEDIRKVYGVDLCVAIGSDAAGAIPAIVASDPWRGLLHCLAKLELAGVAVDWRAFDGDYVRHRLSVPTYPFRRQSHWVRPAETSERRQPGPVREWYEPRWTLAETWPSRRAANERDWVILTEDAAGEAIASRLRQRGARVLTVRWGGRSENVGAAGIVVASDQTGLDRAMRTFAEQKPMALVHALTAGGAPPGVPPDVGRAERACHALLATAQCVELISPRGIYVVTRGAQAIDDIGVDVAAAGVWALGRTLMLEQPGALGAMIDGDPHADRSNPKDVVDALLSQTPHAHIALRWGKPYFARLARVARPAAAAQLELSADGTYLITGGTGALGLETARWLVARGARDLVLVSRRGLNENSRPIVDELERRGVVITVEQLDVADADAVEAMFQRLKGAGKELRGIVHGAGVLDDRVLARQEVLNLQTVFAPKLRGALNLHRSSQGAPLDFFVMFSSAASLLGSPGQANYAAANACLDALAHERRRSGLPATSVNWGPFTIGMAARRSVQRETLAGISAMEAADALGDLDAIVQSGVAQRAVLVATWQLSGHRADGVEAFLEQVTEMSRPTSPASQWARQLRDESKSAQPARMAHLLAAELATVMQLNSADEIDPDCGFAEMGLDSLMAVEITNRLRHALGEPLPATLLFNYPTIRSLAGYLVARLFAEAEPPSIPGGGDDAVAAGSVGGDPHDLSAMLDRVEQLTDDEARRQIRTEL